MDFDTSRQYVHYHTLLSNPGKTAGSSFLGEKTPIDVKDCCSHCLSL